MKAALRAWLRRLANVGHTEDTSDIAAELEANLQLHIDDNIRAGMTPAEARRDAIMKLGGIEPTKESYRDQNSVRWLDNLLHDTRYSLRQLRNNPGFTTTALLILTLGMAASVSIFAFVHAVLLKPLPYQDPATLAGIFEVAPSCPACNLSYPDYLDWKAQTQTLSALEGYRSGSFAMPTREGLRMIRGARVSAGFFRILGIQPALGRNFADGEDKPGSPLQVLITQEAWHKWFDGDPSVVGRRLILNDLPNQVAGVLPKGFQFAPLGTPEFYQIMVPAGSCETRRGCHAMYGVGRIKPGTGIEAVRAEMSEIARRLEAQYPNSNRDQGGTAEPLTEVVSGRIKPILVTLFGGVCLLLLIVWANIASLLLVRSEGRRREMAVRRALGASAGRLITQFVTEGLVLVSISSVAGLLLASWLIRVLLAMIPEFMLQRMPYLQGLEINAPVLWFAAAVATAAAIIIAATPALHLLFLRTSEGLAEGSRGSAGLAWRRMGAKLVTFELATAAILLVGAGLLGKSLFLMFQVDLGFNPDRLLSIDLAIPPSAYDKPEKIVAFQKELRRQVLTLPGVSAAAYSGQMLISHTGNTAWLHLVGTANDNVKIDLPERSVSPEYFSTVG
ncbi:MAG: ABC transporter permease, partial [Acidobacteria bacterium]|nr:ABC transporter permease [Acidobacteriota bacterium]